MYVREGDGMREGWQFTIIDIGSGEILFQQLYSEEYLEDAMSSFVEESGGIELGTKLEITEVAE
jgi:hypothetical protein